MLLLHVELEICAHSHSSRSHDALTFSSSKRFGHWLSLKYLDEQPLAFDGFGLRDAFVAYRACLELDCS